jgi:cytochrome c-type biogenesis protein CcmH
MKKFIGVLFLCFAIINAANAAEDMFTFQNAQDQQRFEKLTTELRCLVCQNQTLAESNAPLATDLRFHIYKKILQGETNKNVVDYLVARYGSFILYSPPFNFTTLILWLGPLLVLLSGVGFLLFYLRSNKQGTPHVDAA